MTAWMQPTGIRRQDAVGRSQRAGFTLIELLVVVAVLALLIGITTPALSAARRISKRTVCGTNLHSIGQAVQAYVGAHNDTYPYVANWPLPQYNPDNYPAMYMAFRTEVGGSREVFRCPADANIEHDPQCTKETYYETVGTSYEWQSFFSGKRVGRDFLTSKATGLALQPWASPMIYDYKAFHGGRARKDSMNVLYADFHVAPTKP